MLCAVVLLMGLQLSAAVSGTGPSEARDLRPDQYTMPAEPSTAVDDAVLRKAQFGDPIAQARVGMSYINGEGVTRDPVMASKWLMRAAVGGSVAAEANLGLMYMRGEGVPRDTRAAARWFESAVRHGDNRVNANLA